MLDNWKGSSVAFSPLYWLTEQTFGFIKNVVFLAVFVVEVIFHAPFRVLYYLLAELPLRWWWRGLSKEQRKQYLKEHRETKLGVHYE